MRFFLILITITITLSSCSDNIVYFKPLIYTDEPQDVFSNSAKLGGEVLSEGGTDVTEYGIVYSFNNPPTINDNKIVLGTRVGRFSDIITSFLAGKTYYYSAFGTNSEGTGYGQVYEFTTMAEAPCDPLDNYIDVTTNYATPQDGSFTSVSFEEGSSSFGGDYTLRAVKGYWSEPEVLDIRFKGDVENLVSGVFLSTTDLSSSYAIENGVVVTYKHHNKMFLPENNNNVYINRDGNLITVTLCDVDFNGTIYGNEINVNVNTRFTVNVE